MFQFAIIKTLEEDDETCLKLKLKNKYTRMTLYVYY